VLFFDDLRRQQIVRTWTTLNCRIDEKGFPPGHMLGRHRAWSPEEVMRWVEGQPTGKIEPRGVAKRNKQRAARKAVA
jgi:hypothetical protein